MKTIKLDTDRLRKLIREEVSGESVTINLSISDAEVILEELENMFQHPYSGMDGPWWKTLYAEIQSRIQ